MKKFKIKFGKCLIAYVVFYLILGFMTTCFARAFDSACRRICSSIC